VRHNLFVYPSLGIPVDDGWQVEVHAWCYRLRSHRVAIPLVRKALGFERTRLSESEKRTFAERARWMFAHNSAGRVIDLAAGGETFTLGKTRRNGRVRATITVRTASPMSGLDIHFLTPDGLSVISDIDDTIRVSHVRDRGALLRGTFVDPFRAVDGMAEVFRAWSQRGAQFHYLSATPWQLYVPIAAFVDAHGFPKGTFHLREFRWKDRTLFNVLASPDRYKRRTIEPLLQRLPRRRFVLVGDSGQRDPEVFGDLARRYPRQVSAIFIRNVGRSTSSRYRTAFAGLSRASWHVFSDPAALPRVLQT
jgi:phosphatidate phosphatase APP1